MSEEKLGQQYLAALHQAFPGVVLDEAWQTRDQPDHHREGQLSAGSGRIPLLQAGRVALCTVRQ